MNYIRLSISLEGNDDRKIIELIDFIEDNNINYSIIEYENNSFLSILYRDYYLNYYFPKLFKKYILFENSGEKVWKVSRLSVNNPPPLYSIGISQDDGVIYFIRGFDGDYVNISDLNINFIDRVFNDDDYLRLYLLNLIFGIDRGFFSSNENLESCLSSKLIESYGENINKGYI